MPADPAAAESVVILGPTATGKSDVAMALAARWPGTEIVAVDSMQVYRGMDIGTGKPTAADRRAVPHHGLDLVDPGEEFTLAEYLGHAVGALTEIAGRGHRALLVGGTGLYLRGLTDPLEIPGQFPARRVELEQRALAAGGTAELYAELARLDPDAAAKIEPANARRIVRALEVTLGSGRRFSSYGEGLGQYPPLTMPMFGLRWPRPALRERIARRVEAMLGAGWAGEVERLATRPLGRTASQALGYRELLAVQRGDLTSADAAAQIVQRTQQFAVRQERWFRRDPRIAWIDVEHDPVAEAVPRILDAIGTGTTTSER